uniref:HN glycoprotein n=1 Tax=Otomys rat paramyxovirus TaxID=3141898 RepID=A0AAU7E2D9_9MONO
MSSIYYTGGRIPQINTTQTYANMVPLRYLEGRMGRVIKIGLKIIAIVSFLAAVTNMILGIILIAQGSSSLLQMLQLKKSASEIHQHTDELLKEQHEFIGPYLRNIMDAVSYQLPRLISNSFLTTRPKPGPMGCPAVTIQQQNCVSDSGVHSHVRALYGNLTYYLQYMFGELGYQSQTAQSNSRRVDIINRPRMNPTSHFDMGSCTRAAFVNGYNFYPAYIGTTSGDLLGTCTRQPVIQVFDGFYSLTYLAIRGSCLDHLHSTRHFEIGVVKRDGYLDPALVSMFHHMESAVPALDGCILAMNHSRAYALCATTNKGPPTDIHEGRTPGLALVTFGVDGSYNKIPVDGSSFTGYGTGSILIPMAGQGVIKGNHLIGFGYMTRMEEEPGLSKCIVTGCSADSQQTCNQNSRLHITEAYPRSMVIIMLDITDNPESDNRVVLIPRDQYYQVGPGNIYLSQQNNYYLYNLQNQGWYDRPIYGKLYIGDTVTLEEYARDYDRVTSTGTCTTPFGCPSTCSVTTSPTYYPMTSDFSVAVGVLSLSMGKTPVVTLAQNNVRLDVKPVRDSTVEVKETSLVCYTQMPRIDRYVFCTALMTTQYPNMVQPSLSSFTWYQPDICV